MRYDSLARRLINLIYPLVIYMAIGLAVMGLYPNGGLTANLMEKTACAAVMAVLFAQDSKKIVWKGSPVRPGSCCLLILIGTAACIGVNMLFEISGLKGLLAEDAANVAQALYSKQLWLEILAIGIAAPIAEELLFRGILYRRLRTWLGVVPSAAIALLIFAAVHGNLLQALYAFVLGAVLIWAYERFGKLTAPILIHMSANLVSVCAQEISLFGSLLEKYDICACVLGLAAAAAGMAAVWFQTKSNT